MPKPYTGIDCPTFYDNFENEHTSEKNIISTARHCCALFKVCEQSINLQKGQTPGHALLSDMLLI